MCVKKREIGLDTRETCKPRAVAVKVRGWCHRQRQHAMRPAQQGEVVYHIICTFNSPMHTPAIFNLALGSIFLVIPLWSGASLTSSTTTRRGSRHYTLHLHCYCDPALSFLVSNILLLSDTNAQQERQDTAGLCSN